MAYFPCMIKIQPIVKEIVLSEPEASYALTHGFMNMSGYADRIRPKVELRTKKEVTQTSLVVALSRIRDEIGRTEPLAPAVPINNITTKLPLSEIVYESTNAFMEKLETLHRTIRLSREDFFTATIGTTEITIICSTNVVEKIKKHFGVTPKFLVHNLAAVGVSFDASSFTVPNVIFYFVSTLARERILIAEIVSSYTELIFIVSEKDFGRTVTLLSELRGR